MTCNISLFLTNGKYHQHETRNRLVLRSDKHCLHIYESRIHCSGIKLIYWKIYKIWSILNQFTIACKSLLQQGVHYYSLPEFIIRSVMNYITYPCNSATTTHVYRLANCPYLFFRFVTLLYIYWHENEIHV